MGCAVYGAGSPNVLAFMYASDIKGALDAVTIQLECVAKPTTITQGSLLSLLSSVP